MIFYLSAFLVFLFDQFFKALIDKYLLACQSIPLINNILHLTYVRNRGAAFGIFYGQRWFLLLIGLLVVVFIYYFHLKVKKDELMQTALGFILGGSLGNLIDRSVRGYVIDYIDIRIWPVFNFADIMIDIGVLLIIYDLIRQRGKKHVSGTG